MERTCTTNEVYLKSGPSRTCERKCDTPTTPQICFFYQPGCYCKDGFLRDAWGACLSEQTCLDRTCTVANEVYMKSGPSKTCERKCDTPTVPQICYFYQPGCYCKDGYLRDSTGNCIAEKVCQDRFCSKPNEIYSLSTYPPWCERKCENPTAPQTCSRTGPGCECKTGYLRDGYSNCVLETTCLEKYKK